MDKPEDRDATDLASALAGPEPGRRDHPPATKGLAPAAEHLERDEGAALDPSAACAEGRTATTSSCRGVLPSDLAGQDADLQGVHCACAVISEDAGHGVKPRVGLISGAANGIGRELAVQASQRGMQLALLDADAVGLERIAAELSQTGLRPWTSVVDVSSRGAVREAVGAVLEEFGQINLCAPIAGSYVAAHWQDETSEALLERGIDVNFWHPVVMCNLVLRAAREGDWPCRFLFAGSDSPFRAHANTGPYAASKAALDAYARSLADELRHDPQVGVTLAIVFPTRTRFGTNTWRLLPEELRQRPDGAAGADEMDRFLAQAGDDTATVVRRMLQAVERGQVVISSKRRPRRPAAFIAALVALAYWRDPVNQARTQVLAPLEAPDR